MPGIVLTGREASGIRSGFFGKLPARRDFVTGNLSRAVTERWHDWLEDGLVRSRELIGEGWLDAYLNLPVWQFALSGGLCGEGALAGVMVPNLDKVGRHFPLVIAVVLPAEAAPAVVAAALAPWYAVAEALALSSLEAGFVFEEFERQVDALVATLPETGPAVEAAGEAPWPVVPGQPCGWQWSAGAHGDPALVFACAVDGAMAEAFGRHSLWWSSGSDLLRPALVAHPGLPGASAFTALLDGQWEERGWQAAPEFAPAGAGCGPDGYL